MHPPIWRTESGQPRHHPGSTTGRSWRMAQSPWPNSRRSGAAWRLQGRQPATPAGTSPPSTLGRSGSWMHLCARRPRTESICTRSRACRGSDTPAGVRSADNASRRLFRQRHNGHHPVARWEARSHLRPAGYVQRYPVPPSLRTR